MHRSIENIAGGGINASVRILSIIPRLLIGRLAAPLSAIWWKIDGNHRQIAISNIQHAYGGELSRPEVVALARRVFTQLVRVGLELPSLWQLNRSNLDNYVTFEGIENVDKAKATGKGLLILSAHLGNWELMALAMSIKFNENSHLLVRPLDFKPIDQLLARLRKRTGNILLDKIRSARSIGRLLKAQQTVSIMFDQNASWYDGVYVPFFGQTACTNKGLALFAIRYDAAVLPVFNIRQPDGRYRILINPPVKIIRSGDLERDIVENTTRFNHIIEKHIRLAPENWMWVHRRWRLKPVPLHIKQKLPHIRELKVLP